VSRGDASNPGSRARKRQAPDSHPAQYAGEVEIIRLGEDEAVLFKPAGLSSERSGGRELESLLSRAAAQFAWPEARLPHRLDRPTRGIVVVARDAPAAARHGAEIKAHQWTKWYFARIPAVGTGAIARASELVGPHRAYLRRQGERACVVRSGGDPSRLTVLSIAPATDDARDCHALIRLDTGRFHQIRVMLAELGFPLVGDQLYGGRADRNDAPSRSAGTLRNDRGSDRGIDLESVALRIDRASGVLVDRLRCHPGRTGVAVQLELALDEAIRTTVSGAKPDAPPA
jgi:23S rRNA-/tRNA-specific pseudouridylate synthase